MKTEPAYHMPARIIDSNGFGREGFSAQWYIISSGTIYSDSACNNVIVWYG